MQDDLSIPLLSPATHRPVPLPRLRAPKAGIPPTAQERRRVAHLVRNYVQEFNPVPPMPLDELRRHARRVADAAGYDARHVEYLGVLINNEMWREALARIPFERRLLLLPKCLRVEEKCRAEFDEFGLICRRCGLCSIADLQKEAEGLGYVVLVAEGSALVMELIRAGKVDGIVGVSCLNVLERAFPHMEAAAVPGVAVPLLHDDCADTGVDLDWVWDYIHLTSADTTRRLDLGRLREEISTWFSLESLERVMGPADGPTERIGREWLAKAGKRWRPFLTVATYQALAGITGGGLPEDLKKIAVAVECFHKASLVHDDIEDNDALRYGEKTLHAEHGLAAALNVGDLLIGEGYRMIGACQVSAEQRTEMLAVAAEGQRQLCRGQGAELDWAAHPAPLSSEQVLDIFLHKTAPAFEVALRLGAIYSGRHEDVSSVLVNYSQALGIAYQIRDDLSDMEAHAEGNDTRGLRPSLVLALGWERAGGADKALLESLWRRAPAPEATPARVEALYRRWQADARAHALLEVYKDQAIRSLGPLDSPSLKGLLRRVVGKVFDGAETQGWCKEFEARNKAARPSAATGLPPPDA